MPGAGLWLAVRRLVRYNCAESNSGKKDVCVVADNGCGLPHNRVAASVRKSF